MKKTDNRFIRAIAIFKLVKGILLAATAIGALLLGHGESSVGLQRWLVNAGAEPGHHFLEKAIAKLANMDPTAYTKIGVAGLVYAVLFLIEGAGLWLQKPWGDWFTVLITGSLVPVEVYEIIRKPTATRVLVMLINVAIVWYLFARIRSRNRA